MSNSSQYIGITGFMNKNEVKSMLTLIPEKSEVMLMVGVLASSKTLNNQKSTKYFGRYPRLKDIKDIFINNENMLKLIHFNSKSNNHQDYLDELYLITESVGKNFDGFQLNNKWPNHKIITEYKRKYPNKVFVLQVGGRAYKAVQCSPELMTEKVSTYSNLVDYVLVDPSGGKGIAFNVEEIKKCLNSLNKINKPFRVGVAGGLGPETVENLLNPLIKNYPGICIDAEGQLRNKVDDSLDIDKCKKYLELAYKLI